MTEYFYTVQLGDYFGAKLEALAARASYDDVEAFAALLLCDAITLTEHQEWVYSQGLKEIDPENNGIKEDDTENNVMKKDDTDELPF